LGKLAAFGDEDVSVDGEAFAADETVMAAVAGLTDERIATVGPTETLCEAVGVRTIASVGRAD
jgi:hypothetical protein